MSEEKSISELVHELNIGVSETLEKHGVTSMIDWLEKLDKRISDIEEKMKK